MNVSMRSWNSIRIDLSDSWRDIKMVRVKMVRDRVCVDISVMFLSLVLLFRNSFWAEIVIRAMIASFIDRVCEFLQVNRTS